MTLAEESSRSITQNGASARFMRTGVKNTTEFGAMNESARTHTCPVFTGIRCHYACGARQHRRTLGTMP